MKITTTMLTQLRTDKSYYLSNTTGTIKETGLWQWFKCVTGLGDGREKAKRLADAVKNALLADASIKSEATLSEELNGLDKTYSLSGASLRQIATRFKAAHAEAIAKSDAYRTVEKMADAKIKEWASKGDVLPEKASLGYIKKLLLYAMQNVVDDALAKGSTPKAFETSIRKCMRRFLTDMTCAENMPSKYITMPRAGKYKTEDGQDRTLNVPRFRLDELHFRAILAAMVQKNGLVNSMSFTVNLREPMFSEDELQKRRDVILHIPLENVKKAGSGAAFAEQFAKSHELYNASILKGLRMNDKRDLPAAFNAAEDEVVTEMRARFGAKAIGDSCSALSLMFLNDHVAAVKPLVEKANAEGRTVEADEVKAAVREKCIRGAARKVLDCAIKDISKDRNLGGGYNPSHVVVLDRQRPEILDKIAACTTPEAAYAAAREFEDVIVAKLQLAVDAEKARNGLRAKAAAMIAKAAGMDVDYVLARLNTNKLKDRALAVVKDIVGGRLEGMDKPGFDIDAAFKGVLDKFVKERIDAMKEVDEIEGMSDNLRRQWKNHVLSTYRAEKLHPAKIHKLLNCGHFSDKVLEEALDAKGTAPAAEKLCSYMGSVNAHFVELFGEDEWEGMGDDERDPVLNMALLAIIDKNKSIADKFLARHDELWNALNVEFNRDEYVAQGHGRKIVEGLYLILVGVDGIKVGE